MLNIDFEDVYEMQEFTGLQVSDFRDVDNTMYREDYAELQDTQEMQVAALRDFYTECSCDRMDVVEHEEPLHGTRFYGPFTVEVWAWVYANKAIVIGVDADNRTYIEY